MVFQSLYWRLLTAVPVGVAINHYVVTVERVSFPTHIDDLERGTFVLVVRFLDPLPGDVGCIRYAV